MPIALTRRQRQIFDLLQRGERFQHPPSLDEVCRDLGLSSRGSLHKHIQALIRAGLVEPMNQKRRGVRLAGATQGEGRRNICIFGYIAAGRPIEAIGNAEEIAIPDYLAGNAASYVLQVRGDSMIEDGIHDGDWIVVESRAHAENGEIVVALIDRCEATLKRIQQQPGRVILHPANSSLQPIVFDSERVTIQGIVTGLIRSYRHSTTKGKL